MEIDMPEKEELEDTSLKAMAIVVERLKVLGLDASLEYPGHLEVRWKDYVFVAGTAADTWGCEVYTPQGYEEGGCEQSIGSDTPSTSTDPQLIVATVLNMMTEFMMGKL
jgi:hypothetical protein